MNIFRIYQYIPLWDCLSTNHYTVGQDPHATWVCNVLYGHLKRRSNPKRSKWWSTAQLKASPANSVVAHWESVEGLVKWIQMASCGSVNLSPSNSDQMPDTLRWWDLIRCSTRYALCKNQQSSHCYGYGSTWLDLRDSETPKRTPRVVISKRCRVLTGWLDRLE